jgi:hypothetical protein
LLGNGDHTSIMNDGQEFHMNIKIGQKTFHIMISFSLSTSLIVIAFVGLALLGGGTDKGLFSRACVLLGGNYLDGGYIQHLTFFAFFWVLLEIIEKRGILKKEIVSYSYGLLPNNDRHIFMANDIHALHFKISDFEKNKRSYILSDTIKKACLKFRSSKSVTEMLEIIKIQIETNKEKDESDQSNIRYLTWAIPSLGFIGTVLGISNALQVANSGDMNLITSTLGVAFDTTLVALILSIIVMGLFHKLQEETDKFHAEMRDYVISNLVNKIEM